MIMKESNETEALRTYIRTLQVRRTKELGMLKVQFGRTYDSLKPMNLIIDTIKNVTSAPELKGSVVLKAAGLGVSVLVKNMWVGSSKSESKKLLGELMQYSINTFFSKFSERFKS